MMHHMVWNGYINNNIGHARTRRRKKALLIRSSSYVIFIIILLLSLNNTRRRNKERRSCCFPVQVRVLFIYATTLPLLLYTLYYYKIIIIENI